MITLLYLIGSVLAVGRFQASFKCHNNVGLEALTRTEFIILLILNFVFSWIALALGTIIYYQQDEWIFLDFDINLNDFNDE